MADTFSKLSNQQQKLKWARIWFAKLVGFHRIAPGDVEHWDFSADQVIAYLRCKRDSKTPAWKRLKILEGIMNYRVMIQNASIDFLIPIRNKMKEIILIERSRESEQTTVKESLDYVDPKECDAIQQFRVRMRRFGLKRRIENSYVGKVKAFMVARGLRCLADFEKSGARTLRLI